MNKSLVSNLLAASLVVTGLLVAAPFDVYLLNTGLFALSGGITNWLAVHMLFERVPGLYGSGVVQIRFEEFKVGIRNLIMEQFFDQADLEKMFHEIGDTSQRLQQGMEHVVDDIDFERAFESLLDVIMSSSFAGMLGMIGGRDALTSLQGPFVERMRDFLKSNLQDEQFQQKMQAALRGALDEEALRERLQHIIDQRLNAMTPAMVKDIVQKMIREHLGWLVVWGCAFGGLIGLVVTLVRYQ
ncbi:MAG: DUF445 domain-containing protein [Gammaproteobacteria bacterium]